MSRLCWRCLQGLGQQKFPFLHPSLKNIGNFQRFLVGGNGNRGDVLRVDADQTPFELGVADLFQTFSLYLGIVIPVVNNLGKKIFMGDTHVGAISAARTGMGMPKPTDRQNLASSLREVLERK